MTRLSYYSIADKYVDIIRQWYYHRFFVKISRKHAVLFALGMVEEISMGMARNVARLRFGPVKIKIIQCDKLHRSAVNKLSTIIMKSAYLNSTSALTTVIIAFAIQCKLSSHKLKVRNVEILKQKTHDMICSDIAEAI